MTDPRRDLGTLGEQIARRHLEARGYALLDANFRTRYGELDVVAQDDRALVFCEVKTRMSSRPPGPFAPLTSVGPRKRRQVRRMAAQWLAERGSGAARRGDLRFDAIGVVVNCAGDLVAIDHLEGAF